MGFIPIFLQVEGAPCLVVGGGEVASRKVEALVAAGARAKVISPEVIAPLADLERTGCIVVHRRAYQPGDMAGSRIVYAATDDHELNRRLFEEASALNIPINVADCPALCSFITPAVVRRGRLQVAISTAGASPALSGHLRRQMESWLGEELEVLVEILAASRVWLKRHEPDGAERARKLAALVASNLGEALRRGDTGEVNRIIAECLGSAVGPGGLGVELHRSGARRRGH